MSAELSISGKCHGIYVFDIGWWVDLAELRRDFATLFPGVRLVSPTESTGGERGFIKHDTLPVILERTIEPLVVDGKRTSNTVRITIFDSGAITVVFLLPLEGQLSELVTISHSVFESKAFTTTARHIVTGILHRITEYVVRPALSQEVEDYLIFEISEFGKIGIPLLLSDHRGTIARILLGEPDELADEQIENALEHRTSYHPSDLAVFDWRAAILFGKEFGDVLAVLEHANVELLELHHISLHLDQFLRSAEEALKRTGIRSRFRGIPGISPEVVGALQLEVAAQLERVDNPLNLVGDQYLAGVYKKLNLRFHFEELEDEIREKLEILAALEDTLSSRSAERRHNWTLTLIGGLLVAILTWAFGLA